MTASRLKLSHSTFSLELRELEFKLKEAYMSKEREAQIAEKRAVEYDKMVSNTLFH